MIRVTTAIAVGLALLGASSAQALELHQVGPEFAQPTYVTSDPGDAGRLFVVERKGTIELLENGTTSLFANLTSMVECPSGTGEECAGERGLLSIAMAPDFDQSGRFYVDYANSVDGKLHISEMVASGGSAPLASLREVLTIPHPNQTNHNGGQLQFGPEGDLFISTGDGGGSNDQEHNAQKLSSLLGKILRIDPRQSGLLPYTVPAGNPFSAATPAANTIWSYGLRNPYRFSFDRLSGALAIGDVGQGAREEIDFAPAPGLGAGANFGWNCREGLIKGPFSDEGCAAGESGGAFTAPVFDYPHVDPEDGGAFGCAIIGGFVARDAALASLYGRYVYADLCTGTIRSLDFGNPQGSDRSENLTIAEPVSFGEDSCGRLYAISGKGPIYRFAGASPSACPGSSGTAQKATYVGIRAQSRRVKRNSRVLLTAFVSPCAGRRGEPVRLLRNGKHVATRRLDRACTVHFRPRIRRGAGYRATIRENAHSLAGSSRRLKLRIRAGRGRR